MGCRTGENVKFLLIFGVGVIDLFVLLGVLTILLLLTDIKFEFEFELDIVGVVDADWDLITIGFNGRSNSDLFWIFLLMLFCKSWELLL